MGVTLEDPRSPLGWPRRRPSLRRRVAELERLLAEVDNAAAQALRETMRVQSWLREMQAEVAELRAWRAPSVRRFDHEPAARRTGSPT